MTGGLRVQVDLPGRLVGRIEADAGEVVAVVGPNGSGKTTLVETIAGIVGGHVEVAGEDWSTLPVHRRRAGLVFQEHLLFPHLDARTNVAFGVRARGVRRREALAAADSWLERLGVADQAHQRPATLSGGQAQRVALARALAPGPQVLLLDEPFAALDVAVRMDLRNALLAHLRTFRGVTVLVTHDALDAHALADRVVVLEAGTVAQSGTRAEVAEAPATPHAARLLGLNVLAVEDVVVPGRHAAGTLATFHPSAVTLTQHEPVGSARNRWRTTVSTAVERDGVVRVHLRGDAERGVADLYADVTRGSAADLALDAGREIWASVKATEVTVFGDRTRTDR